MNSPFALLFVALCDHIRAQVPEIAWIDHDLGQLEAFDGERPPVQWPCLLIDFADTQFRQMQGYQEGQCQLVLRLGHDQYQQTHAEVPEFVQEQALGYYELEHKLHQALQNWGADGLLINPLSRRSSSSEKREDDNFRVRRMVYACLFTDIG